MAALCADVCASVSIEMRDAIQVSVFSPLTNSHQHATHETLILYTHRRIICSFPSNGHIMQRKGLIRFE